MTPVDWLYLSVAALLAAVTLRVAAPLLLPVFRAVVSVLLVVVCGIGAAAVVSGAYVLAAAWYAVEVATKWWKKKRG